jgi:hypothetical protein
MPLDFDESNRIGFGRIISAAVWRNGQGTMAQMWHGVRRDELGRRWLAIPRESPHQKESRHPAFAF